MKCGDSNDCIFRSDGCYDTGVCMLDTMTPEQLAEFSKQLLPLIRRAWIRAANLTGKARHVER